MPTTLRDRVGAIVDWAKGLTVETSQSTPTSSNASSQPPTHHGPTPAAEPPSMMLMMKRLHREKNGSLADGLADDLFAKVFPMKRDPASPKDWVLDIDAYNMAEVDQFVNWLLEGMRLFNVPRGLFAAQRGTQPPAALEPATVPVPTPAPAPVAAAAPDPSADTDDPDQLDDPDAYADYDEDEDDPDSDATTAAPPPRRADAKAKAWVFLRELRDTIQEKPRTKSTSERN